jgi:hypothetical protein
LKGKNMGRVFIEEAMITTGIDRTNLVTVCTHLVRTKQAKSAADAIRKLEAGEFDADVLEEEMIRYYQTKIPTEPDQVEDNEGEDT